MRIMTANLWNVHVSAPALAGVLDEHRPDVVAFQELDHAAAEVVQQRFPYGLSMPGGVEGCALLSREPITVTRTDIPFRPLLTAPLVIGGRSVTVGAVHLANPVAMNDLPHRREQVRALVDAIKGTGPMVLVGDFNSSPMWPAYRLLTRHLRDGVRDWAARTEVRPTRTWNYGAGTPKLLRIDHIMVRGVEVAGVKAIDVAGSDHRALVADLI